MRQLRRFMLTGGFLVLAACATPLPVQEMSNARQAMQAAEAVQAERFAPGEFQRARRLLNSASRSLETGEYSRARELASEARVAAWHAHELAVHHQR